MAVIAGFRNPMSWNATWCRSVQVRRSAITHQAIKYGRVLGKFGKERRSGIVRRAVGGVQAPALEEAPGVGN